MKVSRARLERVLQLRNAAVRLLIRVGYDAIIASSESGYEHLQAEMENLTLLYTWPEQPKGEDPLLYGWPKRRHLLDVWQVRKVFSISWADTRIPYVVAFHPGGWEKTLLSADAELTWASVHCSTELKSWLSGALDGK